MAMRSFFQIIDGQQVEVIDDEEDEEDENETQVLAVEGEDGQQYVVLEVIQLQVRNMTSEILTVNIVLGSQ